MSKILIELIQTTLSKSHIIISQLENLEIEYFVKFLNSKNSTSVSEISVYVYDYQIEKAQEIVKKLHSEIQSDTTLFGDISVFDGYLIVPVDFTAVNTNAAYFAVELASNFNARIKLIHTYGIPELRPVSFDDTDFYSSALSIQLNELKSEAEKRILGLIKQLKDYCAEKRIPEPPIFYSLVNGIVDEVVLYTAKEELASLIVLGQISNENQIFGTLGKTNSRIAEKASCPVLIVPEKHIFKGLDRIKNVVYATNFDELDFAAIHKLIVLLKKTKSSIQILHFGTEPGDPWDSIKLDGMRDYFAKAYNFNNVNCQLLYSENMELALSDFFSKNSVDLIAMVTHKKGLIWKLLNNTGIQKLVYHTQIPLLVFHA